MNKKELVNYISKKNEITIKKADDIVTDIFQEITEELMKDKKFKMKGFGSFEVKTRKARNNYNPSSGKVERTTSKKYVKFNISELLSSKIN